MCARARLDDYDENRSAQKAQKDGERRERTIFDALLHAN